MLYQQRLDQRTQQTFELGDTVEFELSREFMIEAMFLRLNFEGDDVMATANADAILALVQNVKLEVSDGSRTRVVVNASGAALVEYAAQLTDGNLDRNTLAAIALGADVDEALQIVIPIYCSLPNLNSPSTELFMLPLPRYSTNPKLTVEIGTVADVDTNATPTFALAEAGTIELITVKRQVSVPRWPVVDWELIESVQGFTADAPRQQFEIPSPGSYTGILIRGYVDGDTRGFISQTDGFYSLESLGVVIRRFKPENLQIINDHSSDLGSFTGSAFMDFLSDFPGQAAGDLGSVLDANLTVTTGARIQLLQDIAGSATAQNKYLMHRVFGKLDNFKWVTRLRSAK